MAIGVIGNNDELGAGQPDKPKANVYDKANEEVKRTGQDLKPLHKKVFREVGLEPFVLRDLKNGDVVALVQQPDCNLTSSQFERVMRVCHATKKTLGVDVNFLVVPKGFDLKILRPTEELKSGD